LGSENLSGLGKELSPDGSPITGQPKSIFSNLVRSFEPVS